MILPEPLVNALPQDKATASAPQGSAPRLGAPLTQDMTTGRGRDHVSGSGGEIQQFAKLLETDPNPDTSIATVAQDLPGQSDLVGPTTPDTMRAFAKTNSDVSSARPETLPLSGAGSAEETTKIRAQPGTAVEQGLPSPHQPLHTRQDPASLSLTRPVSESDVVVSETHRDAPQHSVAKSDAKISKGDVPQHVDPLAGTEGKQAKGPSRQSEGILGAHPQLNDDVTAPRAPSQSAPAQTETPNTLATVRTVPNGPVTGSETAQHTQAPQPAKGSMQADAAPARAPAGEAPPGNSGGEAPTRPDADRGSETRPASLVSERGLGDRKTQVDGRSGPQVDRPQPTRTEAADPTSQIARATGVAPSVARPVVPSQPSALPLTFSGVGSKELSLEFPVSLGTEGAASTTRMTEIGSTQPIAGSRSAGFDIVRQIAQQLPDVSTRSLPNAVEVSLVPEELGRMRILLSQSDMGVSVLLQSERPETLELAKRNASILAEELEKAGFTNIDLTFGDQGASNWQDGTAEWLDGLADTLRTEDPKSSLPDTTAYRPIIDLHSGQVDIKL